MRHIRVSYTNCFLLNCKEGYLLIDTGFPGEYNSFLKKLAKIDIELSEIKYLLLTHRHDDHSGFAAELVEDTGAKIIAHKEGVPLLEKGETAYNNRGKFLNLCTKFLMGAHSIITTRKDTYRPIKLTENDYIVDGDDAQLLKGIGIDGEILHTPGHTEDSISVLTSDGTAFVGDVAMNFLNLCRIRYRPIWLQNIGKVYKSWNKLIKHGAKTICPAHGKRFPAGRLKKV